MLGLLLDDVEVDEILPSIKDFIEYLVEYIFKGPVQDQAALLDPLERSLRQQAEDKFVEHWVNCTEFPNGFDVDEILEEAGKIHTNGARV